MLQDDQSGAEREYPRLWRHQRLDAAARCLPHLHSLTPSLSESMGKCGQSLQPRGWVPILIHVSVKLMMPVHNAQKTVK